MKTNNNLLVIFICICWVTTTGLAQSSADASATGISRAFNPAISVNCLFDGMASDKSAPIWDEAGLKPGLHYQEVSLEMTSNVDVYLQSKVTIAAEEESGLEVEEAYFTTLRMPIPVIIRGGKMLNSFGRHNLYHLHHMAFAEVPMILEQVFGPDLNETGIEASYFLPFDWYSDFTFGFLNGDNPYLFNSAKQEDFAYLFHLDNLYDLTDEICVRLGGSYLLGEKGLSCPDESTTLVKPDTTSISSHVWGVDFHLKWKPLQFGRYRTFILQGEYVNSKLSINNKFTKPLHGFFVQGLYKFNLNWWLQSRYGWFNRPEALHKFFPEPVNLSLNNIDDLNGNRISFSIAYVPTEFAAYRLQFNRLNMGGKTEQQIVAQVNITIGSHPAHKY